MAESCAAPARVVSPAAKHSVPPNSKFSKPMTRFVFDTARHLPTCRRRAPARRGAPGGARSDVKYGSGNTPRTRPADPLTSESGHPIAAVVSSRACACESPKCSRIDDTTPGGLSAESNGGLPSRSAAVLRPTEESPPGTPTLVGPFSAASTRIVALPTASTRIAATWESSSAISSPAHERNSSQSDSDTHDIMSSATWKFTAAALAAAAVAAAAAAAAALRSSERFTLSCSESGLPPNAEKAEIIPPLLSIPPKPDPRKECSKVLPLSTGS